MVMGNGTEGGENRDFILEKISTFSQENILLRITFTTWLSRVFVLTFFYLAQSINPSTTGYISICRVLWCASSSRGQVSFATPLARERKVS